jgi:hypothetical protein
MSEKKRASRSEKLGRVIEQTEAALLTDEPVGEDELEQAAGGEKDAADRGKTLSAS